MEPIDNLPKKSFFANAKERLTPQWVLNRQLRDAARNANPEQVALLLDRRANPNAADIKGMNSLLCSSYYEHGLYFSICKMLVEGGADVNHANRRGNTALIFAAAHCNLELCKFLLSKGANVNVVGQTIDQDSSTPLLAVFGGSPVPGCLNPNAPEVSALLLQAGADPFYRSRKGECYLRNYAHSWLHELGLPIIVPRFLAQQIEVKDEEDYRNKGQLLFDLAFCKNLEDLCYLLINAQIISLIPELHDCAHKNFEINARIVTKLICKGAKYTLVARELLVGYHDPRIIQQLIFSPTQERVTESRKNIRCFLLCLKRVCPACPKDLKFYMLSWFPKELICNLTVDARCKGLQIDEQLMPITVQTLYDCTLARLKREVALHNEKYPETSRWPKMHEHYDPKKLDCEWGENIQNNINFRLRQPKLLCNGTDENMEE